MRYHQKGPPQKHIPLAVAHIQYLPVPIYLVLLCSPDAIALNQKPLRITPRQAAGSLSVSTFTGPLSNLFLAAIAGRC